MTELTPVELRNGLWYKREDLHRNAYGVNGSKYRACRHLMERAKERGFTHVVSAQSVLSPQSAICATLAEELEMGCTIVVGASKPESAVRHPNIALAVAAGAELDTTPRVAYNGVIQPYAAKLAAELGAWQLPYAISIPDEAPVEDLQAFLEVGGRQVENVPDEVETIVIPFGSGNTAAGVLYGLSRFGRLPERVVLVGVGPDRSDWLHRRLKAAGAGELFNITMLEHFPLHGWFANYGDRMPETIDGIEMHPTYEGKVVRFLNGSGLAWWHDRDETTLFWIVGS
jgi:1-aminocyclopropane-1-carboxylate deaminase/D-cysteine desulfhydrase-like pyridoxal-dependent ACC family enzyme